MIEASFDISLDQPRGTLELLMDLSESRMATPSSTEAVRAIAEAWFVVRFQDHTQDFLDQLFGKIWET